MGNRWKWKNITNKLEDKLLSVHMGNIKDFFEENKNEIIDDEFAFSKYMRAKFKEKGVLQQDVFLYSDIPERYGYKLLSEQKHTRQRDVILRICYAAGLTLSETQRALKLYRLPILYSRIPRDAMLIICFNERPGTVLEVNEFLIAQGQEPLRVSGNVEDTQGS